MADNNSFKIEEFEIKTADDVTLSMARLISTEPGEKKAPVIFIHGSYTKRNFWVSPKMLGLAPHLAAAGYDCWIPELRGHGNSPKGKGYRNWTADDHIRLDLPAIYNSVIDATGAESVFMIGHSAGGLFISAALSEGLLPTKSIAGLVFGGVQIDDGDEYLQIPGVPFIATVILKILGKFNADFFGLGPEDEPAGEMIEYIRWKAGGINWKSPDRFDYKSGLADLNIPLLSFGAAADKNDPPSGCRKLLNLFGGKDKTFVLLGKENGFEKDYGHVDIFVSKQAAREVWPMVLDWLKERA